MIATVSTSMVILELPTADRARLRSLLSQWQAHAVAAAAEWTKLRGPGTNAADILGQQASFIADVIGRLDSAE